ncbi:protease [Haloarcula hispanica N601]|uniref:Protease n=2 Tax=Haloarcula hispanica TaxID=51589 RepID=V5TQ41_HALHI|nr:MULTISPECIES: type II CAAX endopeptidase family protein [Haloarcula]AEM58013.1 putative protease [Haloarcula hispanica ATCC 33960]AHB66760.1 protease [Haloarcula hispanica N601]AJF25061.1 protease [Haloarcula sp. CBA1115]KAA9406318.1 CPBP family intramembrane metalloprotease [Haloarcula sp. CBA1131]
MPEWAAFVGLTGFLLTALLGLARLSQGAVRSDGGVSSTVDGTSMATEPQDPTLPRFETQRAAAQRRQMQDTLAPSDLSTGALLANVAFTQGLFGVLLVAGAFYFEIPASAFGITADALSTGLPAIAVGIGAGVGFWLGNELAAALADGFGVAFDESLRELLAPDSAGGWVVLLGGVLPVIAIVEELLFRAAAIGVPVAGLDAPAWAMAIVASVAFALGHGAQGRMGIVVTGTLGLALAGLFIATNSLLAVVVAHYLVNALELIVHEGLGVDRLWA